jgi:hypothetical protein
MFWVRFVAENWKQKSVQYLRWLVAASHGGDPGTIPSQVMRDLWWTKWYWARFSPNTSVFPANSHFTNWTQSHSTPRTLKKAGNRHKPAIVYIDGHKLPTWRDLTNDLLNTQVSGCSSGLDSFRARKWRTGSFYFSKTELLVDVSVPLSSRDIWRSLIQTK